jgi:hypothetical protein
MAVVRYCDWQHRDSLLLSHHFDDYPLLTLAVEFGVENALPGAEVEASSCDRDNDFVMNEQCLEMRIAVGFAGIVMVIILAKRSELFEPFVDVFDQAGFVVIHVNAGCNVHRRNQHHAFLDPTLLDDGFDLGRDVDVLAMLARVELQIFGVEFQFSPQRLL